MVMRKVGKYEVGRTIGEGNFAKVKFAQNTETGESVAMKVMDKDVILRNKMVDQIKREITVMKLVRHPNVVRLHEVLASRTKIYIILEFVTGGELFDKILQQGKLTETQSRKYFQQLIDVVDYFHRKGVYHRDLKPENLLLDSDGNLKISDFGLSALPQQVKEDGLLHTTCGTPNYVAPEVLAHRGYDGAAADIWSCGVILYVLMAGILPFDDEDVGTLYRKIHAAEFPFPSWFSSGTRSLIARILDPCPQTRITIPEIRTDEWFNNNYVPVSIFEDEEINLDDVDALFTDAEEQYLIEQREAGQEGPNTINAFELIGLSLGLNLAFLFDERQDQVKCHTCFVSRVPAAEIVKRIDEMGQEMGFKVSIRKYKMRLEGQTSRGIGEHLAVAIEVFNVAADVHMVEVRRAFGDPLEYQKLYKLLCKQLETILDKR